jgi:hypothetical protein
MEPWMSELFWVVVILGVPMLIAKIWIILEGTRRERRMNEFKLIFTPEQLDGSGWAARQKRKDDAVFTTVEEWRRDNGYSS